MLLDFCHECGDPFSPNHSHLEDGFFVCHEGHTHDATGLVGPTGEGSPCPNDPESLNAYDRVIVMPEDSCA